MEKTCPEVDLQDWEILPDSNSLLQEPSSHGTKQPELLNQPVANTGYFSMKVENPAVIPAEEMHTDEEAEYKAMEEEEEKKDHTGSELKGKDFGCNWRLTGIGAAVAATVCIFIFGGSGRQHQKQLQKQKIQFKIYADDKRMKEMVQQARRLNQGLSAVRGAPMGRARFSFEGYCANG
ncbi:uncharacterized protein LOC122019836 [Zingiber officinale]|uniref:uncharacterized protein LOC122019836 n=1 Tax=Zingiber officinale TaxID=94328 RepID=UPI001C4B81FD|nr:uncharacterized protein LOC122019836 [Zingiber officinale]